MKRFLLLILLAACLAGCDNSSDDFFGTPSNPVSAPQAVNDAYNGLGNAPLSVALAQGVLVNDTVPAPVTAFQNPSAQGATVAVNADGSFTYTPVNGFQGADTFTYTTTNSSGQSTATVTLNVANTARFVNNTAAPGNPGTFAAPFSSLAEAQANSVPGDTIFVFRGNGNPYTGITLQNNQRLIGEGSGLVVARQDVLAQGTVVPQGPFPIIGGTVIMADGCTVQGLHIGGFAGDGITSNGVDGTIVGNEFADITNPGNVGNQAMDFDLTSGAWTIQGNNFVDIQAGAIVVSGALLSGTATYVFTDNIANNTGAMVFFGAAGTSQIRAQVSRNSIVGAVAVDSFSFVAGDQATLCLDLEGNSTDQMYSFGNSATSTLNVEQFASLNSLNNGTGNIVTGTITEVANGFCNF
ncbi:MAG: Ig-like domain-containing protein [Vulcanimicrobiota bacterium]